MAASVEAIFLSTFVLISQNRSAAEADKRADLDLQISLLTEHELTTLTGLVTAIAERLNLPPNDPKLEEVKKDMNDGEQFTHLRLNLRALGRIKLLLRLQHFVIAGAAAEVALSGQVNG